MLADAHRQAAEDIERAITGLGDPHAKPYLGRSIIEMYWGASFHWIAYGCQQKHGKHKENHTKLVSYVPARPGRSGGGELVGCSG